MLSKSSKMVQIYRVQNLFAIFIVFICNVSIGLKFYRTRILCSEAVIAAYFLQFVSIVINPFCE